MYTDCNQGSQCLLTLHSVSDTNTPLGTQIKTTPEFTENAEQATDAAPRTGIYCDVTYQSGFGDVYVSCPLDVQSEEGFYIRL